MSFDDIFMFSIHICTLWIKGKASVDNSKDSDKDAIPTKQPFRTLSIKDSVQIDIFLYGDSAHLYIFVSFVQQVMVPRLPTTVDVSIKSAWQVPLVSQFIDLNQYFV